MVVMIYGCRMASGTMAPLHLERARAAVRAGAASAAEAGELLAFVKNLQWPCEDLEAEDVVDMIVAYLRKRMALEAAAAPGTCVFPAQPANAPCAPTQVHSTGICWAGRGAGCRRMCMRGPRVCQQALLRALACMRSPAAAPVRKRVVSCPACMPGRAHASGRGGC